MLMVAQMGPLAKKLIFMLLFSSLHLNQRLSFADDKVLAVAAAASDQNPDALALIKFKSSLSYAQALDSWNNPSSNPCSGDYGRWFGVLCFNENPWGIQLENLGLSGKIDLDSLVPLRSLRTISLKNNSFGGPMPDWRKLGALKSIFISHNQFSGQIPADAFDNMHSLKKLDMAYNNFIGSIPLSISKPTLIELRLENNGFTGLIPNFNPSLKFLNVSNNQLEGPVPDNLSNINPSSFLGNKGICGKPLDSKCDSEGPLPDQSPSPESSTETGTPPTTWQKSSLPMGITIIVISILVVIAAIILVIAICYRSNKEKPAPCLGRVSSSSSSSSSSEHNNIGSKEVQVVGAAEEAGMPRTSNNPKKPSSGGGGGGEAANPNKLTFVRNDRQRFDLQDLLRASAEVLGSGNLGSSYKAVLMDGQAVVVKRFKQMNNVGKEEFHEHMRRLGRLLHPNLLPLVAYYYRKEEKLLVFDFLQNGSLATHLHGNHSMEQPALGWPKRLKIVKGVANALSYLHNELPSINLPHGHLKASNVVLDKDFNPLLTDYALAPVVNLDQLQHLLVAYKSPEYTNRRNVTRKTDVWNLGVMVLEILTGKFPTSYLPQGPGYGSDWASWVGSIAKEPVFDPEMEYREGSEGEITRLFNVGLGCCEDDLDKRFDLKDAVEKIQEIQETDATYANALSTTLDANDIA